MSVLSCTSMFAANVLINVKHNHTQALEAAGFKQFARLAAAAGLAPALAASGVRATAFAPTDKVSECVCVCV